MQNTGNNIVVVNDEPCLADWTQRLLLQLRKENAAADANVSAVDWRTAEQNWAKDRSSATYYLLGVSKRPANQSFPAKFVFVQTEGVSSHHFARSVTVRAVHSAHEIHDYSIANAERGRRRFFAPDLKRGEETWCAPCFPRTADATTAGRKAAALRDIDILFVGSECERRSVFFRNLKQLLELKSNSIVFRIYLGGVFHNQLQELLQRSKIVLNIHYHGSGIEPQPLEVARVVPALEAGCVVLSETVDRRDVNLCNGIGPGTLEYLLFPSKNSVTSLEFAEDALRTIESHLENFRE